MYSDYTYLNILKKCLENLNAYLLEIDEIEIDKAYHEKYMECIDASYICIKKLPATNAYFSEYAELCSLFSKLTYKMSKKISNDKALV